MRIIYKIARLELSNLFYSPVAWFLLVLFVFITGMLFTDGVDSVTRSQEFGGYDLTNISKRLFYPRDGFWFNVSNLFFMLMPLLTMGLISQEFNRGSVKLLFAAPITGWHIVFGKYLGIMLYGLLLMGILTIYLIISGLTVESFDWSAVLTGMLGLYLSYGLYAAIGLFMSALTTYQIVAAIGMLALLAFLQLVSGIWQEYALIRDITYWLALGNRSDTFINGLICSEDLLYFIIMSGMFLGLAVLRLQLYRKTCSFMGKTARYLGICAVAMLLGYVTSRPIFKYYYDSTHTKSNTLAQAGQDILAKLDGGLKITTYVNLFNDSYGIRTKDIKKDIKRYNRYIRFKPETEMDYVFYYHADTTSTNFKVRYPGKTFQKAAQDEARYMDTRLGKYLNLEEVTQKIDLSDERYRFVVQIERENGQKTFLRVFRDMSVLPSDQEITAALKRIAMKLPRVGFLSDHNARSMVGDRNRDYSYMVAEKTYRYSLLNQGFDVTDVNLKQNAGMLDSVDVLVVSEPLEPFTTDELEALFGYIKNGKNLILAGKPKTNSYLLPLMTYLGLRFEPGMLVQKSIEEYPAHLLLCQAPEEASDISRLWKSLYRQTTRGNKSVVMPGSMAIKKEEDKGFRTIPLLQSRSSSAWNEMETIDYVNDTARLNPSAGELAETKTTMMGLEREQAGKQQRIIVLGDADCFSMGELETSRRNIRSANGELIMSMFEWLSYEELPIHMPQKQPIDNKLILSADASDALKVILQWILPLLLLVFGMIVLFRRKGK